MELVILIVVAVIVIVAAKYFGRRHKAKAAEADAKKALQLLPERFIVLDLETTGLDPEKHEIIEIAAIKVNRDSIHHDGFQSLIKPKRKVPKRITELTGITQEMLDAEGEPLEKAMREFREFVGEHRLVAYNAEFDMAFLHRAGREFGVEFRNEVSCALKMARRAWPELKSFKLAHLAKIGQLDMTGQHRAMADCKRALVVYSATVAELRRLD